MYETSDPGGDWKWRVNCDGKISIRSFKSKLKSLLDLINPYLDFNGDPIKISKSFKLNSNLVNSQLESIVV